MPTVIDALVVTLGLDKSKFEQGEREANKGIKKTKESALKAGKDMEAAGKQAAVFFSKLRNEALMFVGVLAGYAGVKSFTRSIVDTGTSLGRMSTNLNMSVRDLRAWELAARNAGGSTAGIDAQLKESQNAVAMARRGFMPEGAQEFYLQGGTDIRQFKSGTDYLNARLAVVERIERTQGIAAARLSASRMGLDDSQFSFFRLGASGVSASVDQFRKLAGYTKEDTKNAITLTQKFDILRDKFELVGIRIGTALIPYLDKIVGWLTKLADWVNSHQDTIKGWIDKAIVSIKSWWHELDNAVKSTVGWKNVLIALGALKVLSWVGGFNALAGALMAVGVALKLIAGTGSLAVAAISTAGAAVIGGAAALAYSKNIAPGEQGTLNALRSAPKGPVMDRAMHAVDELQKMGWSKEQAQGIVGNLLQENGTLDPALRNATGHVGIAQWDAKRQADFKRLYGFDISKATLDQQLAFINWELNNTERSAGRALRATTNNQQAAKVVFDQYERAGGDPKDLAKRQGYAGALYARMEKRADVANGPTMPLNTLNVMKTAFSGPVTHMGNTNSSEVNVTGPITIHTQADDAKGVAASLGDYIKSNILATQANTGLQ